MSKYICRNCGELFDEPRGYTERHGLETGPYEHLTCCPVCGGDYEEASECEVCGCVLPLSEVCLAEDLDGRDLQVCHDCADELAEQHAEVDALYDVPDPGDCLQSSVEAIYADHQVDREEALHADVTASHVCRPTLDSAWLLDDSPLGALILATLHRCDPEWDMSWCLTAYDPTAKLLAERCLDHLVIESVLVTHVIPGQWRPLVARAIATVATTQLADQPREARRVLDAATLLDPTVLLPYQTVVCDLQAAVTAADTQPSVAGVLTTETLQALRHDLHWAADHQVAVLVQVGPHAYVLPSNVLTCEGVTTDGGDC